MFDKLKEMMAAMQAGGSKEEIAFNVMSSLLSPSQKTMMWTGISMLGQSLDMRKKPLPKILINRRDSRVVIVYEFTTEQEAIDFEAIESKTLAMVKDFKAENEKVKAASQQKEAAKIE